MTDLNTVAKEIEARLRAPAYWFSGSSEGHEGDNLTPFEAADLIAELLGEIERLQQLCGIVTIPDSNEITVTGGMVTTAEPIHEGYKQVVMVPRMTLGKQD